MAIYPSIGRKTKIAPVNRRTTIDQSDAGTIRIADTGADDIYEITVDHPLLDSTDRATFWAFFDTYRLTQNAITPAGSGDTYNVHFSGVPEEVMDTPTRWTITAKLIGNKA